MRAALAIEQRGVFLRGVEVRGQDHPCEHLLAVGGGYPALLHFAHVYVVVYLLVYERYLLALARGQIHREELVVTAYGHDGGYAFSVLPVERRYVVVARGEYLDFGVGTVARGGYGYRAYLLRALDGRDEEQVVVVGPCDVLGAVVKVCGEISDLLRARVVYHQTVLVRFVAGGGHRAVGYALTVW